MLHVSSKYNLALLVFLLVVVLSNVTAFTSSYAPHQAGVRVARSPYVVMTTNRKSLAVSSALSTPASSPGSSSNNDDVVLREFEKKEAAIIKRRQEAMAKLSEYEASLQALQSKKAEYQASIAKLPPSKTFSETALRSAVKAFVWRLVAGSVTFVTTILFSGSLSTAIQVVGADFFSKSFTMFIGERLMNKTQAGRKSGSDDARRSLAKALVWRLFAVSNTLVMAIFIAKDLSIASKIASTDAVFKTTLMYFYERIWARIQWGKEFLIEFSI